MTTARLRIRRAEPADTRAAQSLFALRSRTDEATDNDAACPDLSNPNRKMWLAFADERAVGMTGVQERHVLLRNQECRMAYWTGLFVDPSYRGHFVYPQLVMAMFAGLRETGVHCIYAAIRRQQVAEAHIKMGFRKIGEMAVLAKPLRPALLVLKYRRIVRPGENRRLLRRLCGIVDTIVGIGIRLQGPHTRASVNEMAWSSPALSEVAALCARCTKGHAAQAWTAAELRARYSTGASGYRLLCIRADDRLVAAVIVRVVDRPEGIRAAVVMDLFHEPGDLRAARSALAAAESLALEARCDVALYLDGIDAADGRVARRRGYLTAPEKYVLLLWYDRIVDSSLFPADISSWRFAFGDHDTF